MMTKIEFSDSLRVAIAFASKLVSGHLNVHPDSNGLQVEAKHIDNLFSTQIIQELGKELRDYRITEIVASDIVDNPEGKTPGSKSRHVNVFITDPVDRYPARVVFDLELDTVVVKGVEGWTGWYATNVRVLLGRNSIPLEHRLIGEGGQIIWGQVPDRTN